MAGEIYIETLSAFDLENIERNGGVLQKSVFHADKSAFEILYSRLNKAVQERADLPAHCYIEFNKDKVTKDKALALSSILNRTSRPAGIVKVKQRLQPWDGSTDIEKALLLFSEIQNGAIILEFYKVGLFSVKSHFTSFTMVNE